jgi:hypothetical protein
MAGNIIQTGIAFCIVGVSGTLDCDETGSASHIDFVAFGSICVIAGAGSRAHLSEG